MLFFSGSAPSLPITNTLFIFVSSSTDWFAPGWKQEWIIRAIEFYSKFPKNRYLLLTKNPGALEKLIKEGTITLPDTFLIGTTLETNRECSKLYRSTVMPSPTERAEALARIKHPHKMVCCDPLVQFDATRFASMIKEIRPDLVYIGFNTSNCVLPEPTREEVQELIERLAAFTNVELFNSFKCSGFWKTGKRRKNTISDPLLIPCLS